MARRQQAAQHVPALAGLQHGLDGMQPTRAQVVPSGPWSMITARTPALRSVLKAFMPAVPAPMTATSTCTFAPMSALLN
jgi:hypothetical protein